jgi:hypothetical protein
MLDKIAYFVDLSIALLIGYSLTLGYAVFRRPRGQRTSFVRARGPEMAMFALVAIPGSFFGALIPVGLVYLVLDKGLGHPLGQSGRSALLAIGYTLFFAGSLVYSSRQVLRD